MRSIKVLGLFFFFILTLQSFADPASWPRWRGPNGDGVSTETGWNPKALGGGAKILWKADVGPGYSNVVIQDGRLWIMGMEERYCTLICLDADTGAVVWRHPFAGRSEPMSTPTVDLDRVYGLEMWGELVCLAAADGRLIWTRDLRHDLKMKKPSYGWASSLAVEGASFS